MTQQPAIVGRHSRALRILTCLQSGPGFNAQELANQMMVSRRTIFRDLNLIRNAGVSIFFDTTHDAYRLHEQSRSVPLPRFQEEDLMKLVLVVQLTYLNGFEDYVQSVREILARLLAGYPQETKDRIARVIHGCSVVEPGITYEGLTREMIKAVFESISRQQQIRMLVSGEPLEQFQHIAMEGSAIWTKFAPYQVLLANHGWSVVGRSSLHRGIREFDIQNVQNIQYTDDSYEIPRGFRGRLHARRNQG
ncbi:MAG: HTH domain-containing protein [Planctomycetota bacterium]|nr:HTH domain-containing protein [Planctomycetota bacterium]